VFIKDELLGKTVAVTSDSWTSDANDTYTGAEVHYINDMWELKSFPLGIVKKEGRAQAVDHVREIEAFYASFGLEYKNVIANVT